MKQDLLYALRGLRKRPLFTAVAVLTLALGIGANAAIFSVVSGVLLRPLPYPDPDRLMMLWTYNPRQGFDKDVGTYPNFEDWRRQNTTFERMAAYTGASFTLTGAGDPAQIRGAIVTPGFFETLGTPVMLGRVFDDREAVAGGERTVILGHGLWTRRFGSDRLIVGRTISLNGVPHEVLGVMPQAFAHPEDADLWTPLARSERFGQLMQARGSYWLTVIGRLKPGVARASAQAEMDTIAAGLERQYPVNAGIGVRLVPLHDEIVGDVRQPLLILGGAVCFVLLIACANVANLLLTRAASRQKELAIRAALGAGRGRLIRQMLTESLVLALAGGGAGLLLSAWGVDVLQAMAPPNVPRLSSIRIDMTVVLYTIVAAVATGLVFGIAPAFQGAATAAGEALKEGGRAGSEGARGRRLRSVVAMIEIAVALVLLVGAGLLVRSFANMNRVDLGFDPRNVLALRLELPSARYREDAKITAFYDELASRLASLPGVQAVGLGTSVLLPALPNSATLSVEGRPPIDRSVPNLPVPYDSVTPAYFRALGIPLVRGRPFTDADRAGVLPVVIVNDAFVRRFFPNEDPLGKRVTFGNPTDTQPQWLTIVGVVGSTRRGGVDRAPWAELYYPIQQAPDRRMYALIRTSGDPTAITGAAQAQVWSIDSDQPISSVRTVEAVLARSQANRRFTTLLLGLFAVVALALAAIGIYGVMAYSMAQRTQEIGIRVALGAARRDVLRMVVSEGLKIAVVGLTLGLAGAFALTRFMGGLLFGVGAHDPLTFVALAFALLVVAALASFIPARRAMHVDPVVALRAE
jgi:putative ABC transport system permease protein